MESCPACYHLPSLAHLLGHKGNAVKHPLSHLKNKMKTQDLQPQGSFFPISKANCWRQPWACQNTKPIYRLLDGFFHLFEEVTWVTRLILPVPLYLLLSKTIKQNTIVRGTAEPRWEVGWEGLSHRIQSIRRKTFSSLSPAPRIHFPTC